jgi:hypothetical protein
MQNSEVFELLYKEALIRYEKEDKVIFYPEDFCNLGIPQKKIISVLVEYVNDGIVRYTTVHCPHSHYVARFYNGDGILDNKYYCDPCGKDYKKKHLTFEDSYDFIFPSKMNVEEIIYDSIQKRYMDEGHECVPVATYELARMEALYNLFLASDACWLEGSDGWYRRFSHYENKIQKTQTNQELYQSILDKYEASLYIKSYTYMITLDIELKEWCSFWGEYKIKNPELAQKHLMEKLPLRTSIRTYPFYHDLLPQDPKKVHPEYKAYFLEVIDYVLTLDTPFTYPSDLKGPYAQVHLNRSEEYLAKIKEARSKLI